jgi:hypothetical protein
VGFFILQNFFIFVKINKMKTITLSIVINSHLSDSLIEMSFNPELAKNRIRFVKILTHRFSDLNQRVSEDELNKIWKEEVI